MNIFIQSLYNLYRSAIRNPRYRWWIVLGTFAYLLSPFDIAPDIFPIVGQIDDVAILTLLLTELFQLLFEVIKSFQPHPPSEATEEIKGDTIDVKAISVD